MAFAATGAGVVFIFEFSAASAGMSIPELTAIFVAIAPGNTTVTPTLVPKSSERKPSVKSYTAALDAP